METQEPVEYSGSSASPPSGILPNREAATKTMKTTNRVEARTNSQPKLLIVPPQGPLGDSPQPVRIDEAPHHERDGRGRGDAEDHLVQSLTDVMRLAGDRHSQALEQVTLPPFHRRRGGLEGRRGGYPLRSLPCLLCLRDAFPPLFLRHRWRVQILVAH